jgi:NosR/NirI family transcriptional regulator, nitrous oxide reductase regulator
MSPLSRVADPQYAAGAEIAPDLDRDLASSRKGVHVIGAAAGAPLLKIAINQGVEVIRSLANRMPPTGGSEPVDLVIVGAGPSGLSAALEARKLGYSFVVLEQGRVLDTIANYPDGKHVYAEPSALATLGDLGLEDSTKEALLEQWGPQAADLPVERGVDVIGLTPRAEGFDVVAGDGRTFACRRVILAIGRMGNPRTLGVPGEDLPCVYTALLNPGKYDGKNLLVVGGGNSAVEAALALSGRNRVTLLHRGPAFTRIFKSHQDRLNEAAAKGRIGILLDSAVAAFRPEEVDLTVAGEARSLPYDAAFVLIGADAPTGFFRRLKIAMEGAWTRTRLLHLAWVAALVYTIYGIKFDLRPFKGFYEFLMRTQFMGKPLDPGMLYGVLYTALVTGFGIRAFRKYAHDGYQRKRYVTLIAAQWLVYFLLPWGLYYASYSEWWRSFAVTLTYPLGYYGLWEPAKSMFSGSVLPWTLATLFAFLVVMPIFSAFHGKRFCAWFCPCGGLADTVADEWRHKAPRGKGVRKAEVSSTVVMLVTFLASVYLVSDYRGFLNPGDVKSVYKTLVDIGLACLIAISLYPFFGGRIWCRFFCPLAKWMELWGRWTGGKLVIAPNDECISCGECTKYCQMGIDVRAFAQREQPLSNESTSCIFCGICVTVCPVDVLEVKRLPGGTRKWRADQAALGD